MEKASDNTFEEKLYKSFAQLDTVESVHAFLQDLCTPKEIQDMAQRLKVAQMLDQNSSYTQIQEQTGASATTIARVSRAIQYGSKGYQKVLAFLKKESI
ncbi:MAG: YerC/YecD family TrpR-related protein [Coriobacteriia bacterium]|nr:YerC/YecD family TrpR-related protein [Coriobacteriia bacterium]